MADMKLLLILLAAMAPYCALQVSGGCVATKGYTVEILSQLPLSTDSLRVHCQSKDNDLGYHNLTLNVGYQWEFCDNYFHTTLFFCHFWWGADRSQVFDVFNRRIGSRCFSTGVCNWIVSIDGFYFTDDMASGAWSREYRWN